MSEICLICLKTTSELLKVCKDESQSEDILQKLIDCVPELDWNRTFQVCMFCCQRLNDVHSFKSLCINSYNWYWSLKGTVDIKPEGIKEESAEPVKNEILVNNSFDDDDDSSFENNAPSENGDKSDSDFKVKSVVQKPKRPRRTTRTFEDKKVVCKICGKQYASKYVLKKHIKICELKHDDGNHEGSDNDNNEKTAPSCLECGLTFKNKYMQKRHTDNVHNREKKFTCDICNRGFASMVYLNAHKRYHSGDRPHVCSFCGKGYITASDLYHHEKIHANKRNYRCERCPKAFNTSSDLYKHKMCVHMDRAQWKYTCDICEKKFPLKINLDSHRKTHTGEKNFPCHLCDRKCINMSVLKRHIITHSHLYPFRCEICDQGYKFQKSLDIHKAKAHGIGQIKTKPVVKKFSCPLCDKAYSANNKLQKHLRAHVGEKPFTCPECHKGFTDKSYVKQHMKVQHNIPSDDGMG